MKAWTDSVAYAHYQLSRIVGRPPCGEWVERAVCRGLDPSLFHPAKGDGPTVEMAKRICRSCVVRYECLEHALANNERYGIYGGLTQKERRELLRIRKEWGMAWMEGAA